MFPTRWRWNATRALAVLRWRGGKKVPPHLQLMDAEDLIAVVFPDQLACLENITGDREIPEHPLIDQTIRDCLEEAMDIDELERLLGRIEAGEVGLHARNLTEASPFAHEIIRARPYAFLDDGAAEERRTLAISTRRWMDPQTAADLGSLDAAAIGKVRREAWPQPRDADELHDALVLLGFMTEEEGIRGDLEAASSEATWSDAAMPEGGAAAQGGERRWTALFDELVAERRATRASVGSSTLWVPAERLPQLMALHPEARLEPMIEAPERLAARGWTADEAAAELIRGRIEGVGPTTAAELAAAAGVAERIVDKALLALEAEGFALRGSFTPGADTTAEEPIVEWCERRLLARIHRYTVNRLRAEIEPVGARDYLAFLFAWHRVTGNEPATGPESLSGLIDQLEGFPVQAAAWESEILPARLNDYDPVWLDALCLAGRLAWARMPPPAANGHSGRSKRTGPIRATPVCLVDRETLSVWQRFAAAPEPGDLDLSGQARAVLDQLEERGASFFPELAVGTGLLETQLEDALGELVAWGLVTADSFTGLRALLVPSSKRPLKKGGRRKGSVAIFGVENAGRWSLLWPAGDGEEKGDSADVSGALGPSHEATAFWNDVEQIARVLLRRYGVVFRRVLEREGKLPPWRDLLRIFRRLEARGEIRGGRFVAGFSGEQFALPEAIPLLRKARQSSAGGRVAVSGADPLNLVGIITPGERLPALAANRVLYDDGIPVATLVGGETRFLVEMEVGAQWEAKNQLVRRVVPPQLRAYLGRSA